MATEILRPNAFGASNGTLYTGGGAGSTVSAVNDDSDSTYLTVNGVGDKIHVAFPTPTGDPDSTQTFYHRLQTDFGPCTVYLYENNSSVSNLGSAGTLGSGFPSKTFGQGSDTWNASLLGTADGSQVEWYGVCTGGFDYSAADIWWDCQYSAGSSVNVTPGSASITVTGYAPTAANNQSVDVSPGAASVTVAGFAPTVDIPVSVTPDAATVTVTGFAPTVENNLSVDVTPAAATITVTGFAPTVADNLSVNVAPDAATVTVTGYAPTVSDNLSVNVTPDAAALTITGFAPTAADNLSVDVTPDAASLTVTGYAPTVTAGESVDVTPDAASITVTGFAPTVADNLSVDVSPDPASIILAGFAPTVTAVSDQPAAASTPKGPGPGGGFLPDTMRAIERGIKKTGKRRKKDRDQLRNLLRQAIEGAEAEGVDLEPVREIAEEVAPVRRALPNVAITLDFTRVERALEAVSAAIRADLEAQESRRLSEWAQNEEDAVVALLMTM